MIKFNHSEGQCANFYVDKLSGPKKSSAGAQTSGSLSQRNPVPTAEVHVIQTNVGSDPVIAPVTIANKVISFEVDTGSGVSVMAVEQFKSLFEDKSLDESNVMLNSVAGPVPVDGQSFVPISFLGQSHDLRLIICSNQLDIPLLGREWLDILNPSWRQVLFPVTESVSVDHIIDSALPSVEELVSQFPAAFSKNSNSCIKDFEAPLVLKQDARPIKHGAYSIAFGALKPVEDILDSWVQSGKAVRVRHADWASPAVPVQKKDGSLRLCVDFKTTLNPQLRVDHYLLPRPDTIFAHLCNGFVFTGLDLKDAYTQLRLHSRVSRILYCKYPQRVLQVI